MMNYADAVRPQINVYPNQYNPAVAATVAAR
jgi:hypothetical protein